MDFCGLFLNGLYLMVVIDDYLKYFVIEILLKILVKVVLLKFDSVFVLFGILDVVKIDNGLLFNGFEFKEFVNYLGFKY